MFIIPAGRPSFVGPADPLTTALRFTAASSQHMTRTFGAPTVTGKWTYSAWIKRVTLGTSQVLFAAGSANESHRFEFIGGVERFVYYDGGVVVNSMTNVPPVLTSPNKWTHVFISRSATGPAFFVWQITDSDTSVIVSGSALVVAGLTGTAVTHYLGIAGHYPDLYMADIHFIDGQTLAWTDFGQTVGSDWVPKTYAGTYGANGFRLCFADSGMRGRDYSGNGNHWTPVNF